MKESTALTAIETGPDWRALMMELGLAEIWE